MAQQQQRGGNLAVFIGFATFIGLGLSSGLLGLAWPRMRDEFGLELDAVGTLLFIQTLGYIASSFFSGRITTVLGHGPAFLGGSLLMAGGLFGYYVAPGWLLVIVCGVLVGFGSGLLDAGLNNYVAAHYGPRQMNWLHASFGVGLTISPFIMTELFVAGLSWRVGYAITAAVILALGLAYLLTLRTWRDEVTSVTGKAPLRSAALGATLRLPILWLSVGLFFVYAGMEIGAGQWAFTVSTESRGIAEDAAGLWVTIYWGSFTVGRILFGFISERLSLTPVLRACMLGCAAGALLWWLNPSNEIGFAGLALLGFAQAPLFPLLILATADRLGAAHAANAIGFQVSAAGVGVAILPGLAGTLAKVFGLETLGLVFFVLTLMILLLNELILLQRVERAPQPRASGAD